MKTLRLHGQSAPVNERVVEMALEIESGTLQARPENAKRLGAIG